MYDINEKLGIPVKIKEITNPKQYYSSYSGASLRMIIFKEDAVDPSKNLIARATGISWNENYQQTPVLELGKRFCMEIVSGAMPPGQLSIQSVQFMHLNDTLPTQKNLVEVAEWTAFTQISDEERPEISGLVIDVFQGIHIVGQAGNYNAQSLYLRNANMMYRKRLTGIEWALSVNATNYPATGVKA